MANTSRYNWPMPDDGGSAGVWGSELNTLFDDHIEEKVHAVEATANAALPKAGGEMTGPTLLHGVRHSAVNMGATLSGNVVINANEGNYQYGKVTGNVTFSFSNLPSGQACILTVELTNGGLHTVNWPSGVTWSIGSPNLQDDGVDILDFLSRDGGTTIYATHAFSV